MQFRLVRYGCILLLLAMLSSSCTDTSSHLPPNTIDTVYARIDEYPSWSPSGQFLLYYHYGIVEADPYGFYKINPDSAGLWIVNIDNMDRRILVNNTFPIHGRWGSCDSIIIASINSDIYLLEVDISELRVLDINRQTYTSDCLRPDIDIYDSLVTYHSNLSNSDISPRIWTLRINQSAEYLCDGIYPSWMHGRHDIVFVAAINDSIEIFKINPSTKEILRLTQYNSNAYYPEYSYDGKDMAYISNYSLWLIESLESSPKMIISDVHATGISWSPDNQGMAFCRRLNNHDNGTVWVVNKDGSGLKQITCGWMNE